MQEASSDTQANELEKSALAYAGFGWHVFPVAVRGKTPLTPHGSHDATNDPEKIREWWTHWPQANIGLALGPSGLTAVDLDKDHHPGQNGPAEWAKLIAEHGDSPTARTITGGGGSHLLFKQRDLGKSTINLANGVDTRGGWYYIILPPSIHPSGKPYEWQAHPEESGIAELPNWIQPAASPAVGNLAGVDMSAATRIDPMDAAERCRRYLSTCPDAISGAGGHRNTFRAACELYRFGLTRSEAWNLLSWFNDSKCQPTWTDHELRHKLGEGEKQVNRDGTFGKRLDEGGEDREIPTDFSYVASQSAAPAAQPAAPPDSRPPLPRPRSVRQLVQDHPALCPPVIHGLLRQGETMNVIAPPKTGKSWLVLDLAISVSIGRPWLNIFPTEAGRVLLIDNELHGDTLADRLPRVLEARGLTIDDVADSMDVVSLRGCLRDLLALEEYFETFDPGTYRMIVLDAFYRFMPKDASENDNSIMAEMYNALDRYAARLGCCFVLIHHTSKGAQGAKSVTDVGAGAGSQSRAADTHLVLRAHDSDGAVVLDAAVRSWKPPAACCLRWQFPVWLPATELDPSLLRTDGRKKRRKEEKDAEPKQPKEEWTVERFVSTFVTDIPAERVHVITAASLNGLSQAKARDLLRLAVGQGLVFEWKTGANRPTGYATVPKPMPQPSVN